MRTCQVGNVGHFHDTHPEITVFISSNLQGQHLLVKVRNPSSTPNSQYVGAYSAVGRDNGGRCSLQGQSDITKDDSSEGLVW